MVFSVLLTALLSCPAHAQEVAIATSTVMPTYISLAPNIHEFNRFADGGPDSGWYVGFNNAWIVKLPPAPAGDFSRAFIGAKVGRAKTRPNPNKPWVRERIEGRVDIGIAQSPAFSAEQTFFLADSADIGLEGDPQAFVEGVGPGKWFWVEVPLNLISFTKPNYLIAYSPSKYFVRASSAPILAGAAVEEAVAGGPLAWNNHSIVGVPPRSPAQALQTPLNNMSPALAIKLVPNAESEVSVGDFSFSRHGKKIVAQFSVAGTDAAEAWIETSRDQLDWARIGTVRREQPFIFSLPSDKLPPGTYLRGAARDSLGKLGTSDGMVIPYGQ
jgi:hypothetical protein